MKKVTLIYKKVQPGTISESLQAFPIVDDTYKYGGKIVLPERVLKKLIDNGYSLGGNSNPLYFKLSSLCKKSGETLTAYASLLEFNYNLDENNIVHLPEQIMQKLRVEPLDHLILDNVQLPTATYLKIEPIQRDFYNLPDYRQILETYLSAHFLILEVGQALSFPFDGDMYDILVKELKVGEQEVQVASIYETDLNLDVVEDPRERINSNTTKIQNNSTASAISDATSNTTVGTNSTKLSIGDEDSSSEDDSGSDSDDSDNINSKNGHRFIGQGYRLGSS